MSKSPCCGTFMPYGYVCFRRAHTFSLPAWSVVGLPRNVRSSPHPCHNTRSLVCAHWLSGRHYYTDRWSATMMLVTVPSSSCSLCSLDSRVGPKAAGARQFVGSRRCEGLSSMRPVQLQLQHRSIVSQAVPVPQTDVIAESDRTVLLSLEEQFKMADIDGYERHHSGMTAADACSQYPSPIGHAC